MHSLADLQQLFCQALDRPEKAEALFPMLQEGGVAVEKRLAIYRQNCQEKLINALSEIYPVCQALVGGDFFRMMCRHYSAKTPSRSADLADYGELLAEFITDFPPARTVPYLADMAQLEWLMHQAFRSAASTSMPWHGLQENINVSLASSVHLLQSSFPLRDIWLMHQTVEEQEKTMVLAEGVTYYFMIWRDGLIVTINELTSAEWQVLQCLQQGISLSDLCQLAHTLVDDLPAMMANGLRQGWLIVSHVVE